MDLYLNYIKAKYNFMSLIYEDIDYHLKHEQGQSWTEIIEYFKLKYSFYDFNFDELSLFDNYWTKTKNDIINTLKDFISNSNNNVSLIDIRNHFKLLFPHLESNHILDLETCRNIDNKICGKCGHKWVKNFDCNMVEGTVMNDNNNNFSCINVGIFTFDQVFIIHE